MIFMFAGVLVYFYEKKTHFFESFIDSFSLFELAHQPIQINKSTSQIE